MRTRVVKVGGSLLRLADLPGRLERWLAGQPAATNALLVGGGRLVDEIRAQQRTWGYQDEVAHELALRAMDLNGRQLAAALSACQLISDWHPGTPLPSAGPVVICCAEWARGESVFERSWRTTSDSIAAELAGRLAAAELVLLKSALPNPAGDSGAGGKNYLDPLFFRHLPPNLAVRLVDLSDASFPEVRG